MWLLFGDLSLEYQPNYGRNNEFCDSYHNNPYSLCNNPRNLFWNAWIYPNPYPNMRGQLMNLLIKILLPIIALTICLSLIYYHLFQPTTSTYLGLPGGVWLSLESADTKTFVFPPVLWFGDTLTLNGNSVDYSKIYTEEDPREFIFPTNSVYLDGICTPHPITGGTVCGSSPKNSKFLNFLIATLYKSEFNYPTTASEATYKFKVTKPIQPIIAFYPLITDDFGTPRDNNLVDSTNELYYLKKDQPYGRVKLLIKLNLDRLNDYYKSRGYYLGTNENEIKQNIKIGSETLGIGSETLEELIDKGICSENGDIDCSFENFVAEKCCPSYISIDINMTVNLTDGTRNFQNKIPIEPISFIVVYYVDKLEDKNYIFENFDTIFSEYENKINIYPCRAIVPPEKKALLPNLKGLEEKDINWSDCKSHNQFTRLNYKDSDINSTWYCKNTINGYYLYNPYGFCKLEYNSKQKKLELPSFPRINYLGENIPSGKLDEKLDLPFMVETSIGEYNEAASTLATYIIYKTIDTFSNGGNIILFNPIIANSKTVYFEFVD